MGCVLHAIAWVVRMCQPFVAASRAHLSLPRVFKVQMLYS